jgi:hypothetical protein
LQELRQFQVARISAASNYEICESCVFQSGIRCQRCRRSIAGEVGLLNGEQRRVRKTCATLLLLLDSFVGPNCYLPPARLIISSCPMNLMMSFKGDGCRALLLALMWCERFGVMMLSSEVV